MSHLRTSITSRHHEHPGMQGGSFSLRTFGASDHPQTVLIETIMIIALMIGVLAFIIYYRFYFPNQKILVQAGRTKYCPIDGKFYGRNVSVFKVERKYADRYEVEEKKACPPEVIRSAELYEPEKYGPKELKVLLDQNININQRGATQTTANTRSERRRAAPVPQTARRPRYTPTPAQPSGLILLNMTEDNLENLLGEPFRTEIIDTGRGTVMRKYFRDPVMGFELENLYVDFRNGRVVGFSEDSKLMKMARMAAAKRQAQKR